MGQHFAVIDSSILWAGGGHRPLLSVMQIVGKTDPGAYRAGDSYLHLFDPRLKLLLLVSLMACLFSATNGWRLLPLFLCWLVAARYCVNGWRDGLKLLGLLRWLLLFTLLLHLFFTPGRTLFGTSWLSYDGLLRGLLVDSQVLLAVLFSLLLAWTTKPERLAWGLTSLLAPLQCLRLPVREAGGLLLLVMQFFPIIRAEVEELQAEGAIPQRGFAGIKARVALVVPLLLRLVGRADRLAVAITRDSQSAAVEPLVADRRLTQFDWLFFFSGIGLLGLVWMV